MNGAILARDSTTDPIGVRVLPLPNPQYLGIEWDAENRLLAINQGTLRSEFSYAGASRRVRIVEKSGTTVTSDRRIVWCESEICEERDESGATVARRTFAWGEQIPGAVRLFAKDHLDSVIEVTDSGGTLLARYTFDPWGRRTLAAGTDVTAVGFTGHYYHDRSGLVLAPFRAYAPELGLWLSEDPVGNARHPRYRYVGNNVANYFDPLGLFKLKPNITYTWIDNPDMRAACGRDAGGACIPLAGARASVTAECEDCGGAWRATNVTIHYTVGVVVYRGDFRDLRTRPRDNSINSALAAASHEFSAHVEPALEDVADIVTEFENRTFGSEEECIRELSRVSQEVGGRFRQGLRESQLRENAFGPR